MSDFIDYYEVLELSRTANTDTIERVFRYLAKMYHPDTGPEGGDSHRMSMLIDAYNVLKSPESRAEYDAQYDRNRNERFDLLRESRNTLSDTDQRIQILSIFYTKRKRDMKRPGVSPMSLSQTLEVPMEILDFHLWYLHQKGWVKREDSGLLCITVEGVDEIERRNLEVLSDQKLIGCVPKSDPFGGTKIKPSRNMSGALTPVES